MTAREWSEELKRRHYYGKPLDGTSLPNEKGLDLVTLVDIEEIQVRAIFDFLETALGRSGIKGIELSYEPPRKT